MDVPIFPVVDPIGGEFPWNAPYCFAEDNPIAFIDLDGLERAVPPSPGRGRSGGRVTGLRSQARVLAEGVGEAVARTRQIRQRAENIRHIRMMRTNPEYARAYNQTQGILQTASKENYIQTYFRNSFSTAESIYGGGNVRDNYKAGNKWDEFVHQAMLENPSYIGIARQVSLKVTGKINGQTVVANIRIDNVGISKDASGKVLFNLVEAKYSINEITINNVKQVLTSQQQKAENILMAGKDVRFYIRGSGTASVLEEASSQAGTAFKKDQDITTHISNISIAVPSGSVKKPNQNTNSQGNSDSQPNTSNN